jgi:hypothetical protein
VRAGMSGQMVEDWGNTSIDANEVNRRGDLRRQLNEINQKLGYSGYWALNDSDRGAARVRQSDLQNALRQSEGSTMPPIFSQAELDRWQERAREHAAAVATPCRCRHLAMKAAQCRPCMSLEGANVQATLTGSAEVTGQASSR